jgi:putative tricarboxylic transport membrane protein
VFVTEPISAGLLAVTALVLVLVALPAITRRRQKIFAEEDGK